MSVWGIEIVDNGRGMEKVDMEHVHQWYFTTKSEAIISLRHRREQQMYTTKLQLPGKGEFISSLSKICSSVIIASKTIGGRGYIIWLG